MSAPSPIAAPWSWRAEAGRWSRRAAAALGSAALDAALDSLGLGKRCLAWLAHAHAARAVAVAALALALAGGAAWAAGCARRESGARRVARAAAPPPFPFGNGRVLTSAPNLMVSNDTIKR